MTESDMELSGEQSLVKMKRILEEIQEKQTPKLQGTDRRKLKFNGEKVDRVLQHVPLTLRHQNRQNNALEVAGNVVTGLVGAKLEDWR